MIECAASDVTTAAESVAAVCSPTGSKRHDGGCSLINHVRLNSPGHQLNVGAGAPHEAHETAGACSAWQRQGLLRPYVLAARADSGERQPGAAPEGCAGHSHTADARGPGQFRARLVQCTGAEPVLSESYVVH